jgi:hypothetical protein
MKKLIIYIASFTALSTLIFSTCKNENAIKDQDVTEFVDTTKVAFIRVVHAFAGNTPQLPTAANLTTGPQVFIYANGAKLNGNALSYGGQWPSPNVYATVPATSPIQFRAIMARLNLSAVPNIPAPMAGDTLLTVMKTLTPGKKYTMYFGDTVANYTLVENEDILNFPPEGNFQIRMANWSMVPTDTFDVWSRREQRNLITNVWHKQISPFSTVVVPDISDTLDIRRKGSTTATNTVILAGVGLRHYTIVMRGKGTLAGKNLSANILTTR